MVVSVVGTPYVLGYHHGQQVRELIVRAIESFCRFRTPGERTEKLKLAAKIERNVSKVFPEALEEMSGIADGCGLPHEDILLLNLSNELWGSEFAGAPPLSAWIPQCTVIGILTMDGLPLVGQNTDLHPGCTPPFIDLRLRPATGLAFLHCTVPGTLWTSAGVNEKGLAWCDASLLPRNTAADGMPIYLVERHMYQHCATVEEAVAAISEFEVINYGNNILVADGTGHMAIVEKSTRQAVRRLGQEQEGRVLFAANHSVSPELESILGGSAALLANSAKRYANLTRRRTDLLPTLEGLERLLSDHSPVGAICQHGPELHTLTSHVVDPARRTVWGSSGPPCTSEFRRLVL